MIVCGVRCPLDKVVANYGTPQFVNLLAVVPLMLWVGDVTPLHVVPQRDLAYAVGGGPRARTCCNTLESCSLRLHSL